MVRIVTFHDSSTITYTYDAGDRITQLVDSANGTITRQYDNLDRLTQEATPQGTTTYTYDADGRRATMTVAGQTAVSYSYDNAHRLTSITQGSSTISLTYDNANRRSTLTFPNAIVATSEYDNVNRLTSLTYALSGNTLGDLTYTYDTAGNRTSVGGSWARTGLPTALASATYDAANRIATWGSTSVSYDLNGNLANDGLTTYTWNVRDQLTGLSGGASASFQYDGVGRRRGKTISGITTNFLYDGLNLVQELTGGGTPSANLLTGLGIDEAFTRTDAGGTSTLLTDALGSTLALTDGSGTVQTSYTYDPFGATSVSGATSTNAAQFTGRENDGAGLYYYRARFYSAELQRFTGEDPLGLTAGLNLFAYAGDAPTVFVDPLGLKPSPNPGQPPRRPRPRPGNRPGGNGPDPGNGPEPKPPNPNDPKDPDRNPRQKDPCKPYWNRVWDDFSLTNRLPGLMVPTGLNLGLRSSEAVGGSLGLRTIGQLVSGEGLGGLLSVDNLLELGLTHGATAITSGLAFETGVGAGSMLRALFECQ